MMSKLLVLCALTAFATTAEAQFDPAEFERVLVPIVATRQVGAFQSLWTTQLRVRHENEVDIVFGYDSGGTPTIIAPDATYSPRLYERLPGEPEGALIYIRRSASDSTHFSLRVQDESRNSLSAGVDVPVVRENNLLSGRAYLLGIASDSSFRRTLRIYDAFGDASSFLVRVFDDRLNGLIDTAQVSLTPSSRIIDANGMMLLMRPAAATLDLDQLFPGIREYQAVTVEIDPSRKSRRWWAFVSVTNNVTQEVTLVVP